MIKKGYRVLETISTVSSYLLHEAITKIKLKINFKLLISNDMLIIISKLAVFFKKKVITCL